MNEPGPAPFDVVALFADEPAHALPCGRVGTVVETLDSRIVLVEFNDEEGRTWALVALPAASLLVLRYQPLAA